MTDFDIIRKCRVCGSEDLTSLLFFGDQPLANGLKKGANDPEDKYPLTLLFCPNCSLVQLRETVNKEVLFSHYVWVTGTSATAQKFASDFYGRVRNVMELNLGDLVIEIASNDGTFLKPFIAHNHKVVGVDPATNVADIANENGVRTINAFWSSETARNIAAEYGPARFIFARNVIPHVSELHDVMSGIGLALDGDGFGAIEVHYAGNIFEQLQYDSIYHEHLCYFSIKSMEYLLRAHGFTLFNIDLSPISGGAFIFYFSKDVEKPRSPVYETLWAREQAMSLNELFSWRAFAECCHEHRQKSREIMASFPRGRIIGFGASARSSTFLNFCRFTGADLAAIIDNNKIKQGLFTAGSSIPIVSSAEGFAMNPELIFVLAWNFRVEVINECREKGYNGAFLVPFPNEPYLA